MSKVAEPPRSLSELMLEVSKCEDVKTNGMGCMLSVLRRHHLWPALQVKKFNDDSNLILLHNTYKRIDVDRFKELYDECRSVILDLTAEVGKNVVVTYAQSIPTRMTVGQYAVSILPDDKCTVSYEGTVVTAYEYNGTWHFGTSTCTNVNHSRYFHPTKTHGMMLDDAIASFLGKERPQSDDVAYGMALRSEFAEKLNKEHAYAFLLVHSENKHIIDYSDELGDGYATLFQLNTRKRETLEEINDAGALVVPAPLKFETPEEAISFVESEGDKTYGIFVRREDGELIKVSSDMVVRREEIDLGSSNSWQNLLHVYMLRKPDYYTVNDYINEFKPDITFPVNSKGEKMSPTHIIHLAMCGMRDVLTSAYRASTYFHMNTGKYRKLEGDAFIDRTIKFHINQLRFLQITHHTHRPINAVAVFSYLCHHNTMKNIRLLMDHVSSNPDTYSLPFDTIEATRILSQMLRQ